ncbi:MAG: VOC family protein [Chthoniobacteraceae bacterium]
MTDHQAEQFDLALHALLDGRNTASREFADLLAVGARLRELPHSDFQVSLGQTLERMKPMTATATAFKTVTPFIIVREADILLKFLETAFDAQIVKRGEFPEGGTFGEVRVGEAMLMFAAGAAADYGERRTALHYFVDDVDAAYRRAIAAGAKVMAGEVGEPADRPYGERSAFVEDPSGNMWFIAKHLGPEGQRTGELTPYLHPRNARQLIAFLEKAFGAQGLQVVEHDGKVMHAAAKLGDSLIEMGEGEPFAPQALFLNVEDPDAVYHQALAAGATSLRPPEVDSFGQRSAIVEDQFGNRWFPARMLR